MDHTRTSRPIQMDLPARCIVGRCGNYSIDAGIVSMSRSGALIERRAQQDRAEVWSELHVETDDAIQVEVDLPIIRSIEPRCLWFTGRIARLHKAQGREYIGLCIYTMQFRSARGADVSPQPAATDSCRVTP